MKGRGRRPLPPPQHWPLSVSPCTVTHTLAFALVDSEEEFPLRKPFGRIGRARARAAAATAVLFGFEI